MRTLNELKISRATYYKWAKEHPEFKARMIEADMSLAEDVEAVVLEKIFNERSSADAQFYLKRKGRCIGYDNSVDFIVKDKEGESKISIEELDTLIKELKAAKTPIKDEIFDIIDLSK
jgi:oligoribonuclease NrnB/cAMP/cGMP phosphodiesterase (DHH superfamily)